ncbi:MAG: asparaginase [Chloroflexi bacterium]|nr:asparaginase [Chloroflexota bacterium]
MAQASSRPRVAVVGTGGSISIVGRHSLDLAEYGEFGRVLEVDELLALFPETSTAADLVAVRFRALRSTAVGPRDWLELNELIHRLIEGDSRLAGVVVTHGTATLEETAYFLNLTLKVDLPVVVVGAQRPPTGLSTDAALNLVNAIRVAAAPAARGLGVLTLLNDEIQAAREVTKASTYRLQAFRSPDVGLLGYADPDGSVAFYRAPTRRHAPDTIFDTRGVAELPRVDIAYSYAGSDGAAVEALVARGARGIVVAGLAPGMLTPGEGEAAAAVRERGVLVVLSTRAGSGRVLARSKLREAGIVAADNLSPQKARVLAMLALLHTSDPVAVQRLFDEY